jgi:hypothetical protein
MESNLQLQIARQKLITQEPLNLDECAELLTALETNQITIEEAKLAIDAIDKAFESQPNLKRLKPQPQPTRSEIDFAVFHRAKRLIQQWRLSAYSIAGEQGAIHILRNWNKAVPLLRDRIKVEETAHKRLEGLLLEKAKLLAVNHRYQASLTELRQRWGVEEGAAMGVNQIQSKTVDDILVELLFKGRAVEPRQIYRLKGELKRELSDPFYFLDWREHQNLIIASFCFGLKPDDLMGERDGWVLIWLVAKQGLLQNEVVVQISDDEKMAGALLTISYLSRLLQAISTPDGTSLQTGQKQYDLPKPIGEWVKQAAALINDLGIDLSDPTQIPDVIDKIQGRPTHPLMGEPRLYLRVDRATKIENLKILFPRLRFEQIRLWGDSRKENRQWREFERDVELFRLYEQYKTPQEAIRQYAQRHQDQREFTVLKNERILDHEIDLFEKAVQRYKGRSGQ